MGKLVDADGNELDESAVEGKFETEDANADVPVTFTETVYATFDEPGAAEEGSGTKVAFVEGQTYSKSEVDAYFAEEEEADEEPAEGESEEGSGEEPMEEPT